MSARGAAARRKVKKKIASKKAGASSKKASRTEVIPRRAEPGSGKMPSKGKATAPKKTAKTKPAAKTKSKITKITTKKAAKKKPQPGSGKAARKTTKKAPKRAPAKAAPPKKASRTEVIPRRAEPGSKKAAVKKAAPKKASMAEVIPRKAEAPRTGVIPRRAEPGSGKPASGKAAPKLKPKAQKPALAVVEKKVAEPIPVPAKKKEEPVSETLNAPAKKPGVLRVARGERRPTSRNKKAPDPVEQARAALARVGTTDKGENGQIKKQGRIVEINPRLESSREKIESKPEMQHKPPSVAERKRQEAEAAFQKIAPQHNEMAQQHFHKSRFDVRISERDSLATQIRMSGSHEEALRAARDLADRYRLPPDQVTLLRIVELGDERLTKLALEELLELDDKGRVRPTSDLITTVSAIRSKDAETIELKDLLLEKVGAAR